MIRARLQKELQELAENICREENKKEFPAIHFKHNRRGHTYYNTGYISIPIWSIKEGRNFLNYYLIHEVTHFILNKGHCLEFKNKEIEILSRYGLEPNYAKVYVKKLLNANSQVVWDRRFLGRTRPIAIPGQEIKARISVEARKHQAEPGSQAEPQGRARKPGQEPSQENIGQALTIQNSCGIIVLEIGKEI